MTYGWLHTTGDRRKKDGFWQVRCTCRCGTTKWFWERNLTGGLSTSCGCRNKKYVPGSTHGELTVMSRNGRKAVVQCSCGSAPYEVYAHALKAQTSCGCLALDRSLVGETYGDLEVVDVLRDRGCTKLVCRCTCGTELMLHKVNVVSGRTKSCGHWKRYDLHAEAERLDISYNEAVRLRSTWTSMHKRCYDERTPRYPNYGGRGIKVCEEWHDFRAFLEWAVQTGAKPRSTMDRIDNDGNYGPDNCRWATDAEQSRNKSTNRWVEAFGERKILTDWASDPRCAVRQSTLSQRILGGWDHEYAITAPPRSRKNG